jgi:hypothetical protein
MSNPFLKNRFTNLHENGGFSKKIVATNASTSNLGELNKQNAADLPKQKEDNIFTKPRSNMFSRNNRRPVVEPIITPTFNIEQHVFPNLGNMQMQMQPKIDDKIAKDFKDVVNTVIDKTVDDQNSIKPGWVEVTRIKGQTRCSYRYGEKTEYQTKIEEIEKIKASPNYIMNTAINNILKQRERHITEYNNIHGDEAYEDRFIMSPCYGSEYETDGDDTDDLEDAYYDD